MNLTLKYLRNNIDGIYSITTDKVAKKLDISRRQYSRLENGHVKELDEVKIEKLANLFKVTKQTIKEAWENSKGGIINDRNNKN
ncbi:XRE family transcriptional regulator [Clostridium botulinum]|uniref:helix-turn-helix domain-containing protein n=1 Tax=Clostridium sporogenes TaxID=1509 RepID=UPI0009BBB9E8|nr:helix-turn-helix transcriptional regulator [Clostridium botulinum]MBA4509770.1 helix-turn-helix transcriptional regulator [Clostridium sporogenes]MBO0555644.1 XRE family transcriptional regulator [Clostridium botulinum]